MNISTVYRTLEVLEELDLVRHAHITDRAPTYHSAATPAHVHLVCRSCGKVTEVSPDVVEPMTATLEGRLRIHHRRRSPDGLRHLRRLRDGITRRAPWLSLQDPG